MKSFSASLLVFFLLLSASNTAFALSKPGSGTDESLEKITGAELYFSGNPEEIRTYIKEYSDTYDLSTPEGQIDYILSRVETSPFTFERNGKQYSGSEGAQFFRWKMYRPKWVDKVHTAQDFVTVVCKGSSTSGKPYLIILPTGEKKNLQIVFQNELDLLNNYLAQNPQ